MIYHLYAPGVIDVHLDLAEIIMISCVIDRPNASDMYKGKTMLVAAVTFKSNVVNVNHYYDEANVETFKRAWALLIAAWKQYKGEFRVSP